MAMIGSDGLAYGSSGEGQDQYKWDTEQIEASINVLKDVIIAVEEAKKSFDGMCSSLETYWKSSSASEKYYERVKGVSEDMAIFIANLDGFAGALSKVTAIYDDTENQVSAEFTKIEQNITKIDSVVGN